MTVVRLGVLLPLIGTEDAGYSVQQWSPIVGVYQALREINNKSDGVADWLLPTTQLRFTYRDSKCDSSQALQAALHLTLAAFGRAGVSAIIGAGCSEASMTAAQVVTGVRVPMVSPSSTAHALSDSTKYPYFLRTIPSDAAVTIAMVDVLVHLFDCACDDFEL